MSGRPPPVDGERFRLLARGIVVPVGGRCIECGICVWSCPMGLDVRAWARAERPVSDARCILCGSCVAHCPRGNLLLVEERVAA